MLADSISEILSLHGYFVRIANSAEDAIQLMYEGLPDLVVSDYWLDGMTGIAFANILQESPQTANIPFLLLTGVDSSQLSGDFEFDNIVRKPFDIQAFIRQIETYLSDNHAPLG